MSHQPRQAGRGEIVWIIPGILIAALIWYFFPPASQVRPPALQHATLLPEAKTVQTFRLSDHRGRPFTPENLQGHWTLLFFGYTHCPDVCPTTLQTLAGALRRLDEAGDTVTLPQVVFVSVDPARDSRERLAGFVSYFNPDFIGVTGEPAQIERLTRPLGILYAKAGDGTDYLVDHSAAIVLFDPSGRYRALFNVPHDPAAIAADFQAIRRYYEARFQ